MQAPSCESIGRTSPIMETFAESAPEQLSLLTFSAAGSHVKTYQVLEINTDSPVFAAGYGANTLELLASYDRDTLLWRTSQTCLLEGLARFSETWPRSGLMRNGIAYRLATLAPRSLATASGLLPTLVAGDSRGGRNGTLKGRSSSDGLTVTDWLWLNVGRGRLHPESAEWMMGYPEGWTALSASEMPSSRKSSK